MTRRNKNQNKEIRKRVGVYTEELSYVKVNMVWVCKMSQQKQVDNQDNSMESQNEEMQSLKIMEG